MTFPLFSQVQLTQDIPEFNLKKDSIGVIVELLASRDHTRI